MMDKSQRESAFYRNYCLLITTASQPLSALLAWCFWPLSGSQRYVLCTLVQLVIVFETTTTSHLFHLSPSHSLLYNHTPLPSLAPTILLSLVCFYNHISLPLLFYASFFFSPFVFPVSRPPPLRAASPLQTPSPTIRAIPLLESLTRGGPPFLKQQIPARSRDRCPRPSAPSASARLGFVLSYPFVPPRLQPIRLLPLLCFACCAVLSICFPASCLLCRLVPERAMPAL